MHCCPVVFCQAESLAQVVQYPVDIGEELLTYAKEEPFAHILLAAHPTVGHTSALRAIGAELRARGHATSFALMHVRIPFAAAWPAPVRAAVSLPKLIAAEGANVLKLNPSPRALWYALQLPHAIGQKELEIALALFTSGLVAQARRIAAHTLRIGAAVVVGDYLMPAALLGACLARRPFVALYHSALPFPATDAPPFGTVLPKSSQGSQEWHDAEARLARMSTLFDQQVARAAAQLHLPAPGTGLLTRPISPNLNLLATAPVLEPGLLPLAGHVLMTGPCLRRPTPLNRLDPSLLNALPARRPTVYISLGTVFNGKPNVYRTLIAGAQAADASVIVSAGASEEALADLRSSRVRIFQQVPQVELLEHVDTVITHGGNNTVQECLAAARPMVVIPFGGDQQANARRIERLGVGVAIPANDLTLACVRDALMRTFGIQVIERARRVSQALGSYGGACAAADGILALAAAPVNFPHNK